MTLVEAAHRLHLSTAQTSALARQHGWRVVGRARTSAKGPEKFVYSDDDVRAFARERAAELRRQADRIDPEGWR